MGELPLADIDLSLLAHSSGETATNTLNRGKGVDDLLLAINVGVEDTKNVLELSLVHKTLFPWSARLSKGQGTYHIDWFQMNANTKLLPTSPRFGVILVGIALA